MQIKILLIHVASIMWDQQSMRTFINLSKCGHLNKSTQHARMGHYVSSECEMRRHCSAQCILAGLHYTVSAVGSLRRGPRERCFVGCANGGGDGDGDDANGADVVTGAVLRRGTVRRNVISIVASRDGVDPVDVGPVVTFLSESDLGFTGGGGTLCLLVVEEACNGFGFGGICGGLFVVGFRD